MMDETNRMNGLPAVRLDMNLDVRQRLAHLQTWITEWQAEDERLRQRVLDLNPNRPADVLLGAQIGGLRRHLTLKIAQQTIYLDPTITEEVDLVQLRRH